MRTEDHSPERPPLDHDDGTIPVIQDHFAPARDGAEADQFRARLQAAATGLRLDRLPGYLLVPQFDAVIICNRASDLNAMESVRQSIVQTVRFDDGTAPRILLNEQIAGNSSSFIGWLNEANIRSTFVFIYVTNEFLQNAERLRYIEHLYNESVSGPPHRRDRILPLFAPGVSLDNAGLSNPKTALFRNLDGVSLEHDAETGRPRLRPRQVADLRRLMRDRVGQRRQREDAQVEAVRDYVARANRQEGALMLQRTLEFFTDRMGCPADEVKWQMAYFYNKLQMAGEPPPDTHGMLVQEVGSQQQVIPSDSGHATMASNTPGGISRQNTEPPPPPAQSPSSLPPLSLPLQQQQRHQQQIDQISRAVENLHVGTTNQVSIQGDTVHVHVTYVNQFVAGATQAHQHVAEDPAAPDGAVGGGGSGGAGSS